MALLALVAIGGCGAPAPKPPPPTTKTPPPVKGIKTSAPEITVESEDGMSAYIVRAKQSEITVNEDGPEYGELELVEGEVRKEGVVASEFQAKSGIVDRDKETLLLVGAVKISGDPAKREGGVGSVPVVLSASKVLYDQKRARFEAEGSVTVTSGTMTIGPMERLWASSDLKTIATPGKFK